MGRCAAQSFSNITPDERLALQTKAAANQVILNGESTAPCQLHRARSSRRRL